ncbi:MAG: divergent PAP2 family protein [Acutalibacteraceae bacterium]
MGKVFTDLFFNYILVSAVISWFIAQVLKFIITYVTTGKSVPERLVGSGGMPSSHTALVCSATIAAAKSEGTSSSIFAVCFIIACVVMYDAMNVRRQAGEHAKVINRMINEKESDKESGKESGYEDITLKEKLGHTPLEVLGGALLGIVVAMIIGMIVY